jgi:signal transduction histidine kinase
LPNLQFHDISRRRVNYAEQHIVEKKPTFFWQGLLILLPMLLLVTVGVYSIRQDKNLAEAEAKERAQRYADELQGKIATTLTGVYEGDLNNRFGWQTPRFVVDEKGKLIHPPAVAPLNPTSLNAAALHGAQAQIWNEANNAEFTTNRTLAIGLYRKFLTNSPPPAFRARAAYSLAVMLGRTDEAKALFSQVSTMTNAVSDAGLPLSLFAQMKLAELASASTNQSSKDKELLTRLCPELVERPTVLTEPMLELAARLAPDMPEVQQAKERFANDERARELYASIPKETLAAMPESFWIDADEPYLAMAPLIEHQFACLALPVVRKHVDDVLKSATYIPDYFGVTVEIARRELTRLNATAWSEKSYFSIRSPGGLEKKEFSESSPTPVLATSSGPNGKYADLKVTVVMTNRAALFKQQRTRMIWFLCVIGASGLAGVTGLWRSWRTFLHQQQLNEMKSNFVSSVSHELRAPIASVRLLAEALDRGAVSEPPKQKEYFRFIVQECRRLTGLIENVLDFSRIEQGRKQYHFEETDLKALVEQTVKLMEPMAKERGVTLEITTSDVQSSTFNVVCDGLAVQQALVNLIDNAVKHSAAGEMVLVGLESERRTSNAEHRTSNGTASYGVRITVEDHGPGIPAEEHEKIFERFYRRGSELRRETQGIGIGLTIVKHVAEAHGGRVGVESEVGKGSIFTLELPINLQCEERARNPKFEIRNPKQTRMIK